MSDSTFLTRVVIKNFKSIAACDVRLGPLMFFVGPNGAGKTNFLDALQFVADALTAGLDEAIRRRGGFPEVLHRGAPQPEVALRLEFRLGDGRRGIYSFAFGAVAEGARVRKEYCLLRDATGSEEQATLRREDGEVRISPPPSMSTVGRPDRLYLTAIAHRELGQVLDSLTGMRIFRFDLAAMRTLQPAKGSAQLLPDGKNIAAVLNRLSPERRARVVDYLRAITPELLSVEVESLLDQAIVGFTQTVAGAPHRFLAPAMSEGTLRALGILVALLQPDASSERRLPLIGLEEPEHALHPGALAVLLEALREGSAQRQVLVTTHSADLLENKEIRPEEILALEAVDGTSQLGPVDESSRTSVRDRLFTAGELLRIGALRSTDDAPKAQLSDAALFSLDLENEPSGPDGAMIAWMPR